MKFEKKNYFSIIAIIICLYAPLSWLLLFNPTWQNILSFCSAPGVLPMLHSLPVLRIIDSAASPILQTCTAGIFTFFIIIFLYGLSMKNNKYLILSCVTALICSGFSSFLALNAMG